MTMRFIDTLLDGGWWLITLLSSLRQQRVDDVAPASHRAHVRQEAPELVLVTGPRLEKVEMRNDADEMAEHLEAVVDEMGDAELLADDRLLATFTTEANLMSRNPGRVEEVLPLEPLGQHALPGLVAPRDQPDAVVEPLADELADRFQRAVDRRRAGVAAGTHGAARVVFADPIDDDAPDVDAEHFPRGHAGGLTSTSNTGSVRSGSPSTGAGTVPFRCAPIRA